MTEQYKFYQFSPEYEISPTVLMYVICNVTKRLIVKVEINLISIIIMYVHMKDAATIHDVLVIVNTDDISDEGKKKKIDITAFNILNELALNFK